MSRLVYPVVLPVNTSKLSGAGCVEAQRDVSRLALEMSANHGGFKLGRISQTEAGVPVHTDGLYWSLSHKPTYVAAVVSDEKVGIDIEKITPRREMFLATLKEYLSEIIGTDNIWQWLTHRPWDHFYRVWTAKEAVVKALGLGIECLRNCQIHSVEDAYAMILKFQDALWQVEQKQHNGHLISVVKGKNDLRWVLA